MPFPPWHTQTPRPLPGHGEEHIPLQLLIFAVKMLHILPRACPLRSSTGHSLAPDRGFLSTHTGQALSPAQWLFWLPSSCFYPPGQGPVLQTGTLSLFGVRHPGVPLFCPLTNNQRGLCISQRLLMNSGVLWDPKSCPGCSPGTGEGARGWRKRGAAG